MKDPTAKLYAIIAKDGPRKGEELGRVRAAGPKYAKWAFYATQPPYTGCRSDVRSKEIKE